MKHIIKIGETSITLQHDAFDEIVNVDDLTRINTSNLFGEAVTISASVNRIGLLLAEVQATMDSKKLEVKIFESNYRSKLRKEAFKNKGSYKVRVDNEDIEVKLTEKSLETCFYEDAAYKVLYTEFIQAENNYNKLAALYWASQDKARKLNGIVAGTKPEDFIAGIIEGKINGILVEKPKVKKAGGIG